MADLCVSLLGLGAANGSDWSNSLPASFTAVRNNRYFYAKGVYPQKQYGTAVDGVKTIQYIAATVANHGPSAGWVDIYAGEVSIATIVISASYQTFNGQTGGGPVSWKTGFGFKFTGSTAALCNLDGALTSITLQHINMVSDRGATFIAGVKGTTGACTNILIEYCAITDVFGPLFHWASWSNAIVRHNYLARNRSTDAFHSEGMSTTGTMTDNEIYSNWWDQIEGTAVFAGITTGSSTTRQKMYNNLVTDSTILLIYYVDETNNHPLYDSLLENNTVVGSIVTGQSIFGYAAAGSGNIARGNIFNDVNGNYFGFNGFDSDYTWAYGCTRTDTGNMDADVVLGQAHGVIGTASPFVDRAGGDYRLNPTTTAKGASVDLSATFTDDIDGLIRTIPWDMGAHKYVPYVPPVPPVFSVNVLNVAVLKLG